MQKVQLNGGLRIPYINVWALNSVQSKSNLSRLKPDLVVVQRLRNDIYRDQV